MTLAKDLIRTVTESKTKTCHHCGKPIKGEYETKMLPGWQDKEHGHFRPPYVRATYHPDCLDKVNKKTQ